MDAFEQLGDTGTNADGAINALRSKFKELQHQSYDILNKTWDSFISKLKAEGEDCDMPAGWLNTKMLMVRGKLVQDKLTVAEAFKHARVLEVCVTNGEDSR